MAYKGYGYHTEIDDDEDTRKTDHILTRPDGTHRYIPFSPYEMMTAKSFETWIDMGMPSAVKDFGFAGNFNNAFFDEIAALATEHSTPLTEWTKLKLLRTMKAS